MMSSFITQSQLKEAYLNAITGKRPYPVHAKKISTKTVKLAYPGDIIETYIDSGNTIKLEVTRTVPNDGKYIIIIDDLSNSTTEKHQYFIPYDDFIKRYTLIDGTSITSDMSSSFETTTMVQSKGYITAFTALNTDTPTGKYENPPSWGKGIADGANNPGYWVASIEKPDERYFIPILHFERDYVLL